MTGSTVSGSDALSICGIDVGTLGRQPSGGLVASGDESQRKRRQAVIVLEQDIGGWSSKKYM